MNYYDHAGDTATAAVLTQREEILRREARAYFAELEAAERVYIPGGSDCWTIVPKGVPCFHPDGLGHAGEHL